jgi:membrane-bound lytic murein transglycosylase A
LSVHAVNGPVVHRGAALLACFLLLGLLTTGCAGSESAKVNPRRDAQFFKPLTESIVVPISAKEAESLSLKMEGSRQGMNFWRDLDFAVSQSLAYATSRPAGVMALDRPGLRLTYGKLVEGLRHLKAILPRLDDYPGLLAKDYTWYRIGPDFGITGYYEPTLRASRKRSSTYYYPLYKVPPDLRKGKGYHTRKAIDRRGALAGRGLELAWVDSETDAFFLHIQGSGRLRFEDGSVRHILYAGKNNQAYKQLGRIMRDAGLLDPNNITMQSIRKALEEHPSRKAELFDQNPSYVFFRESDKGPYGAMGRPLTPWVSTASDRQSMPHGALNFLITSLPDAEGNLVKPFYGLTLPQDVGGAIKGNRLDLFCGPGAQAEHAAGHLNARGAVYVLVKK